MPGDAPLPEVRARRERLAARWRGDIAGADDLLDELLQRWSQTHRHYHDLRHLEECLSALDTLRGARAERLAAWFHDAVYDGQPGRDETRSAELARARLSAAGTEPALVSEVERLIMMTIEHDPAPGDAAGERLNDAVLAILGASPTRYAESVADIRAEYAHVDDAGWRSGRRAVLDTFLSRDALFRTRAGAARWQRAARANVAAERARLG